MQTPTPPLRSFKWKAAASRRTPFPFARSNRTNNALFLLQMLGEIANADAVAAQKQKLDCALQLARTVSLDFNNALTSIIGHTSLILTSWSGTIPGAHR